MNLWIDPKRHGHLTICLQQEEVFTLTWSSYSTTTDRWGHTEFRGRVDLGFGPGNSRGDNYPHPRWVYNATQRLLAFLVLPPLDNYCDESGPGEIFQCTECGYLRPWSRGALDGMEEVCDHCWAKHERNGEVL